MVKLAFKPEFQTTKEMIDSVDRFTDETPLMCAVNNGCVDIARLLINAGADMNIQNSEVCYNYNKTLDQCIISLYMYICLHIYCMFCDL